MGAKNNPDDLALLPRGMRALEQFVERFNNEQSFIIESLVDLNRSDDFENVDSLLSDAVDMMYFEICDILARLSTIFSPSTQRFESDHLGGHTLPKIELPRFDECIIHWCFFRDMFTLLVHHNVSIDDITRFHYVLSCVSGSASSIVKSVSLTAANYPIAW